MPDGRFRSSAAAGGRVGGRGRRPRVPGVHQVTPVDVVGVLIPAFAMGLAFGLAVMLSKGR